jgi:murein L,D-transpeptidase YcbB/YkuD
MAGFPLRTLLVVLGLWCTSATAATAAADVLSDTLAAMLQAPAVNCGTAWLDRQQLVSYYAVAEAPPLWVSARGAGARAQLLRTALQNAGQEGLTSTHYRIDDIKTYWSATTPAAQACLDLLLTAGFDRYSRDVRRGLVDPQQADPSWQLQPPPFDPVAMLQAAGSDSDLAKLFATLPPAHTAYARLRTALARYRRLAEQGGWPPLPPGPTLELGVEHEQVALLRARLRSERDLPLLTLSFGTRFDAPLAVAVENYQRRHGLTTDGIVGRRTRAALNVSVVERAAQLRRAMERLRWLPRDLGNQYILVNTAGFELAMVEDDKTVLRMRTINGTPEQATPSFTATLQTLVINPYWNVPERIARERLWPRAQVSPDYLSARGFRVFDTRNGKWLELDPTRLDWTQINGNGSGVRLRQEPGPANLMGRLSFVLPNPFDVFLHDTPDRALFERDTRTFSEGCVRIENAMALALRTLRRTPEWSEVRIQEEIDALHHRNLRIPEPIPVYILYLPSWVDDYGRVQFRDDVYGRESVLVSYYPAN